MSDAAVAGYPVPGIHMLADDFRMRILQLQERAGFVPNVFLALAHRPKCLGRNATLAFG